MRAHISLIAALFLATGAAHADPSCDTEHTSDTQGIWQCGNVCVRLYGHCDGGPLCSIEVHGLENFKRAGPYLFKSERGGLYSFKWSYKTYPFEASLNGKRCKMLKQTYDYEKQK